MKSYLKNYPELRMQITALQTEILSTSGEGLLDGQKDSLRALIRVSAEFDSFAEHPDSADDRIFLIENIFSCLDCFTSVNGGYHCLIGALSPVELHLRDASGILSTAREMFREVRTQPVFETRCRVLLDLYRLMLIYAGLEYGR